MLHKVVNKVLDWGTRDLLDNEDGLLHGTSNFDRSFQMDDYSCAAHSAYMIARHFGVRVKFKEVLEAVETTTRGTANKPLISFFRSHGLKVAYRPSMTSVELRNRLAENWVVIVHLDGDHVGVVHGLSATHVYLADPSLARMVGHRLTKAQFRRRWTGWGIAVRR